MEIRRATSITSTGQRFVIKNRYEPGCHVQEGEDAKSSPQDLGKSELPLLVHPLRATTFRTALAMCGAVRPYLSMTSR